MTRNILLTLAAPLVLVVYSLALAVIIVGGVLSMLVELEKAEWDD